MIRLEDHPGNFRDESGRGYLVHCPMCERENYAMCVSKGVCAWCGWKDFKQEDEE